MDQHIDGDSYLNISLKLSNDSIGKDAVTNFGVALHLFRNISIPLIIVIGLFGNTISLLVFSSKSMKASSCSVFLASLAFVDNVFLVSLCITWIDGFAYPLLTGLIWCKLIIFTTYVASFLSVWFVVGFTFERFIAICFPLKTHHICSRFREKAMVAFLVMLSLILYNHSFWTIDLTVWDARARCSHLDKYIDLLNVLTWMDTALTMIVPFIMIVVMNSMVLRAVIKGPLQSKSVRRYTFNQKRTATTTIVNDNTVTTLQTPRRYSCLVKNSRRINPQYRVTRTLMLVSTTFLFLNLPSHAIRLYNLITSSNSQAVSKEISVVQEFTLMLYYTTFSCNFFLYTFFGRNFKNALNHILRCLPSRESHRHRMLKRLSSIQGQGSSSK